MPSLSDIVEVAQSLESSAVYVVTNRCVAVRNRNSTCTKCADVCIAHAINIKNNKLSLDGSLCVSCGACTTICPTEALVFLKPIDEELSSAIDEAHRASGGMCVFACARADARHVADPEKYAVVPCLARMEESELLRMAAKIAEVAKSAMSEKECCQGEDDQEAKTQSAQEIVLVDGTCKTCKYRGVDAFIDETCAQANTLLAAQGSNVRVIRTNEFPLNVIAQNRGKTYGAARRNFFTQAGTSASSAAKTVAEKTFEKVLGSSKKAATLRETLGIATSGTLPQFQAKRRMSVLNSMDDLGKSVLLEIETRLFGSLEIDTELCSSCLMCTVFCPTAAIVRSELKPPNGKGNLIEFSLADCTQCNLCADACMKKCLHISPRISLDELFDFEPRIIQLPEPPARPGIHSGQSTQTRR